MRKQWLNGEQREKRNIFKKVVIRSRIARKKRRKTKSDEKEKRKKQKIKAVNK